MLPNDRLPIVERRVWPYLDAGTRAVWVIQPETRTATVRRPEASAERLAVGAVLAGGEVVPGFSRQVAELIED